MIKKLISKNDYKQAYEEFIKLHPHDQSLFLESISQEEQEKLLSYLNSSELSDFLSYLEPEDSAKYLSDLPTEEQIEILDQMEIDDAVDLIDELDEDMQDVLLKELDDSFSYKQLLDYEEYQAGSIMTPSFIKVNYDVDVKVAMKELISMAPEVESISNIFVVDNNKYLGSVNLNVLIKAKSPVKIEELIIKTPYIYDTDDISMSIHQMREYGLYEIAVCNDLEDIIGIITLDDAIERYEDELDKDFANLSAISDIEDKSLVKSAIHRLPWLIILLLTSIPIAFASSMFEEVIVAVSILALFQPLILDASGDVATQTLAVTLRKLNQTDGASLKEGLTEVITGLINGVILGIAATIITFVMAHILKMGDNALALSLVVGLSLVITVIIGPILGFIVPVLLNKVNVDPAVASGPFITTLVDILSLLIYFGLATLLLGGMIYA